MASKANIFNSLPQHQSDSEGEDQNTRVKRPNEKRDAKTGNKKTTGDNLAHKANKEEHSRTKETRPQKGVSGEPHPQDRHSGTGHAAYGGKPKKGGSGKGNWGSEKRPAETRGEEEEREGEEGTQEPQEEEKPALTLQEYYAKRGNTSNQSQVNEAKAKITSEQLYKEMGTATVLKTRQQSKVDDHKVGKKKDHLDVDHHAAVTTEHAGLLNFRTGFVEKEYKQRGQDETGPRKFAPRTQKKTEEVKEETEPATQPAEGEAQPVTEGQTAPEVAAEGQDNQNRRRQDGQRGNGRGGYKGERPQGERPQGGRKPYAGKPQQAKVDFADESAFPKLG